MLCARLDAVCAVGRFVRDWVLCALGAVSAVRALLTIFFVSHSETRMLYFLSMQIAACWLVAVSAQAMNPADAAALNQTLTGLGCWQSPTCNAQNFSCSSVGVDPVRCNANGSVTYL